MGGQGKPDYDLLREVNEQLILRALACQEALDREKASSIQMATELDELRKTNVELMAQAKEMIGANAILEQEKARAEEGEQLMRYVLDQIPEGVTIAGVPDVRILCVSKFGQQLTGRPREALEGIGAEAHPESWGILRLDGLTRPKPDELPLTRATKFGEVVTEEEWLLERPDCTKIAVSCSATPIRDAYGKIIAGVIVWRRVTGPSEPSV